MPDFLDVRSSSEYLKVPPHALYRAAKRRAIGFWRIGCRIMFTKADLDKLIQYVPPKKAN